MWTHRLMVSDGHAALIKGVANRFGASATLGYSWGERFWQLPQGELPNTISRKTALSI